MTIHEVKKSLGRRVSYNGSDCYELTGCIIRKAARRVSSSIRQRSLTRLAAIRWCIAGWKS